MWSAIGRATARQVRVGGGRLAIRSASRLAVHSDLRTAPTLPSGIRVTAVFARGLAAAGRPKKTTKTEDSAAPKKKAAAKKPATKKKTTAKAAGKKTAKAKAPVEKKAKMGRPKKQLTEEEEAEAKLRETRQKIRALKAKALLKEEPNKLAYTSWMQFVGERGAVLRQENPDIKLGEITHQLSAEFKALPTAELERLGAAVQQNKVSSEISTKNWVDGYTVHEIHEANLARQLLRRKYGVHTKPTIPDSRFPTKYMNAYVSHFKARALSPEYQGVANQQEKLKMIAEEWKQLSPEARKPFEEMAEVDKARYTKEMEAYREGAAKK